MPSTSEGNYQKPFITRHPPTLHTNACLLLETLKLKLLPSTAEVAAVKHLILEDVTLAKMKEWEREKKEEV